MAIRTVESETRIPIQAAGKCGNVSPPPPTSQPCRAPLARERRLPARTAQDEIRWLGAAPGGYVAGRPTAARSVARCAQRVEGALRIPIFAARLMPAVPVPPYRLVELAWGKLERRRSPLWRPGLGARPGVGAGRLRANLGQRAHSIPSPARSLGCGRVEGIRDPAERRADWVRVVSAATAVLVGSRGASCTRGEPLEMEAGLQSYGVAAETWTRAHS